MNWFYNINAFFQSLFEFMSFRTKPESNLFEDIENPIDYEYVILNDKNQKMIR
jgi:hypothetical protein